MKKLLLLSALFISFLTFAQVPQGISYQAIALNGTGTPVASSNVRVKLSILDATATGTTLYSETNLKLTNANGLFNLTIGQGTVVSGAFNTINWGTNLKFLKVEMDAAGGTTYVLVGTTQLLSVPYALAADSLVTSAGEGITLVSPDGTPYILSVNNAGQLSLPTSGVTNTTPSQLYMYGSFNSFNAGTALLFANSLSSRKFYGYKYLTSGTQLKFLPENNSGAAVYGINSSNHVVVGGGVHTISANGFYMIGISHYDDEPLMLENSDQFAPQMDFGAGVLYDPTYNPTTNVFTFTATGVTSSNFGGFYFNFPHPTGVSYYGDFLNDGSIESGGTPISIPNLTTTPKNFRITLTINFNGSGTYTITQI